jgi:hypothetical protein
VRTTKTKTLVAAAAIAAALGTMAAECRATENSPFKVGPDGTVTKVEKETKPIRVRNYFITVRSSDGRDRITRFEANKADYEACQVGELYPTCAGR